MLGFNKVYKGKLREAYGGAEVAVKVQRPGVLSQVSLDLYVMRFLANTVVKSWQKASDIQSHFFVVVE